MVRKELVVSDASDEVETTTQIIRAVISMKSLKKKKHTQHFE
jgi:hypothetical protein